MWTRFFLVLCVAFLFVTANRLDAQPSWQPMNVETKASLRGLCVYDDQIVWASGTDGTIVRSYDQGQTWRVEQVAGAEKLDFRDLNVLDKDTVVAMTSGTPARIYRTDNRGESWKVVYESIDPKVFLDSLSFLDPKMGVVMGDPIDGTLFLLKTTDGGQTWSRVEGTPKVELGEAGFAASGTNLTTFGKDRIWIATGGGEAGAKNVFSRILMTDSSLQKWETVATPIRRHESGGIFSLVMIDAKRGVAVGGDYKDPERAENHFAITEDGGQTWKLPENDQQQLASRGIASAPTGYRSCVATLKRVDGQTGLLAVGPEGTDLSVDLGKTWVPVSEEGFHAAQFSPSGKVGWGVGSEGRISKWQRD
jgi:photosystem II stability/assembly factor-like uncharacterized protein